MTQAILFMGIVPAALLAVLLFAKVSGYLSEHTRARIEGGVILTLIPLLVLHFCGQIWERWQGADASGVAFNLVGVVVFTAQLIVSLRSGVVSRTFRGSRE